MPEAPGASRERPARPLLCCGGMSGFQPFPEPSFNPDEEWGDAQSADDWRGDEYLDDWPRESAGPEWRMFEQIAADEADMAAAVEELLKSL